MLVASVSANALTITKQGGWFEAAYAEWTWESGATYEAYVKAVGASEWTKLDNELLRNYGSYGRVDAVGLKAGQYQIKITSSASGDATTNNLTATAHDRSGFAHVGMPGGIGAYKNDGTLKANAKVLYVHANNAKTVSTVVKIGSKDTNIQNCVGLQSIIDAYQKGYDTTPIAFRIIGTIKKADLDHISSTAEGLQVKGKGDYSEMPITIEGIGNDATISGFGILLRNAKDVEIRNFAIMLCMDDCLSLDTKNSNIWIHNMDFFYGGTGGDADQAKGDGTVDIKAASKNVTVSYNHFYDSGKCSLGGMSNEITTAWHTYHHNWFDHSDSRHPRIRVQFFHVYNNYYDGISKYGIGAAEGGTAFVESNYFRNTKYPMLSSKQGTDAEGDGTFSGEPGGVIKAYNNKIINAKKIQWWSEAAQAEGTWDAVNAASRDEAVTATAYSGGTSYNSAADAAARQAVPESAIDPVDDVALICRGEMAGREGLGAGRMNGGDFKWTFLYTAQDANYDVISDLKSTIVNYKSTLVGLADGTTINNGGAAETVDGGDGKGYTQKIDENTPAPSWGADVPETDTDQKTFIGGTDGDFYWFDASNDTKTKQYNADGIITWDSASSYGTDKQATSSDGSFTGEYVGAIALKSSTGYATFYCPDGITSVSFKVVRSGSAAGKILASADGTSFTEVGSYSYKAKGTYTITQSIPDGMKYVRLTNTSGGTLYVHGVKIMTAGAEEPDDRMDCDLSVLSTTVTLNIGEQETISYSSSSTGAVTFSSTNSNIASVSADGQITAKAAGTASIIVSQQADGDYKAGKVTVSVTVTDPRAASSFALSSDASVSIKEGETSQIATTGAAGTVTYKSSNTAVATVSADGQITAVAAGSATITITDAGTDNVMGKTLTVTVAVTKDMTGTEVCDFTDKKPSSSMVDVSGNYSDSKGSVTYNGTEYKICVKMESKTSIKITPASDCKVTLVFYGDKSAGGNIYLNDTKTAVGSNGEYTFTATGGTTYELKKGDTMNLFLVIFEPVSTGINNIETASVNRAIYSLDGRSIAEPQKGQLYIVNGKKYIAK